MVQKSEDNCWLVKYAHGMYKYPLSPKSAPQDYLFLFINVRLSYARTHYDLHLSSTSTCHLLA